MFRGIALLALCAYLAWAWGAKSGETTHVQETAAETLRWWKGNTHTHTLWSDGDAAPEVVAEWYKSHGYHFLVLSDHNVLSRGERWFPVKTGERERLTPERVEELRTQFGQEWVDVRESQAQGQEQRRVEMRLKTLEELRSHFESAGEFLFIEGEEITAEFQKIPVHVNAMNLNEQVPPARGGSVREVLQKNIDAVVEYGQRTGQAVLAHVNHPNFHFALTAEDVASISGDRFFEVYNGHPSVWNHGDATHPSTERIWDLALTLRLTTLHLGLLYGLATDDSHHYFRIGPPNVNPGRGWIFVRASRLEPEALIDALKRGDFYASSGVRLHDFSADSKGVTVQIENEPEVTYVTRFIGTRREGETGAILAESRENVARYDFQGDEHYVRATVISSRTHPNPHAIGDVECAWIQPVLGPAAATSR